MLARIMHHASRYYGPDRRTHAVDPSVWIGLRQLAVQRIGIDLPRRRAAPEPRGCVPDEPPLNVFKGGPHQ
jgi:hypothetical protein